MLASSYARSGPHAGLCRHGRCAPGLPLQPPLAMLCMDTAAKSLRSLPERPLRNVRPVDRSNPTESNDRSCCASTSLWLADMLHSSLKHSVWADPKQAPAISRASGCLKYDLSSGRALKFFRAQSKMPYPIFISPKAVDYSTTPHTRLKCVDDTLVMASSECRSVSYPMDDLIDNVCDLSTRAMSPDSPVVRYRQTPIIASVIGSHGGQ